MKEQAIDKTLASLYNQLAKLEATRPFHYRVSKAILKREIDALEKRKSL